MKLETSAAARHWTRDELLLALNLYRKLKFGQLHGRNPVIIALAAKLDRSPNSLAMKLCNFASLDPLLRARGIRGLEGASRLDKDIWNEAQEQPIETAVASEEALRHLFAAADDEDLHVEPNHGILKRPPSGPTEQLATRKIRRAQQFFREMILNNFESKCCITGLPIRDLLVASHILPWSQFPHERLNPQNGLCLSRLHDGAFDLGLITFDSDLRLVLSKRLKDPHCGPSIQQNFTAYEGQPLCIPSDSIAPSPEFLQHHQKHVFQP